MGRGKASKGLNKNDNDALTMKLLNESRKNSNKEAKGHKVVKATANKAEYVPPSFDTAPLPPRKVTFIESIFTQKVEYDEWVEDGAFGDVRSTETLAADLMLQDKMESLRTQTVSQEDVKELFFAIIGAHSLSDLAPTFTFNEMLEVWDALATAKSPKLVDSSHQITINPEADLSIVNSMDIHVYLANKDTIKHLLWVQQKAINMLDETQFENHFPGGPPPVAWIASYTHVVIFGYNSMTLEASILKIKGSTHTQLKGDDILFVM